MLELTSRVTVDHSDRLRSIPDTRYNRDRTIHLRFLRLNDGYLVQAWGSAFPQDGGGGYQGRVLLDTPTLQGGIADLQARWHNELIDQVEPGERPTRHPFVDNWNLAGRDIEGTMLTLARAGHDLFILLFRNGDAGLKEICDLLLEAMRSSEHIVTVESDELFVPWGLLYIPLDDNDSMWKDDYRWDPRGFWGYRHLIEHNFSRSPGFDSRITLQDSSVIVGMNIDKRVDVDFPLTPCVGPMIDFFSAKADTTIRTRKAELAAALQSPDFADHIVYFGCHGQVSDHGQPAYLVLGDDEKIYSSEVVAWLSNGLPTRPVVFLAACQGGQLASAFYPAFGYHLLRRGARCLIGPQIDLPRAFAREYATRLFDAFLVFDTKLGDIVRDLAREFLDQHHNPLGLVFSLHRGIDVHLGAP